MLLNPGQILLWGNRIVTLDGGNSSVRVFSRTIGRLLWKYERTGRGPGELTCISHGLITPRSRLWVLDGCANRKILEFDSAGALLREIRPRALPQFPGHIVFTKGAALVTTQLADRALVDANPDSLTPERVRPIPWPDSLDSTYRLDFGLAAERGDRPAVVLAYQMGPAFLVMHGDSVEVHPYVQPVPFSKKVTPQLRTARADSARYAALSTAIVGDEVYFLFGGRPRRRANPGEPTLLIDVYGLEGTYHRSYLLPADTRSMATEDGNVFYLIVMSEGLYPQIIALRPRIGD